MKKERANQYVINDFYYIFGDERVIKAICKNDKEIIIAKLLFQDKRTYLDAAEIMNVCYDTIRTKHYRFIRRARKYIAYAVSNSLYTYELQQLNKTKDRIIDELSSKLEITKPNIDALNVRIIELGLSSRALSCLQSAEIETLQDLISFNKNDLLKFRNFGLLSLAEVKNKVHNLGLKFRDE